MLMQNPRKKPQKTELLNNRARVDKPLKSHTHKSIKFKRRLVLTSGIIFISRLEQFGYYYSYLGKGQALL